MMPFDRMNESKKYVRLNGAMVRKCDVPLGKEFIEEGRVYQSLAAPTVYGKVTFGARYRHGDEWYYKDQAGPKPLDPNMPFGEPFYRMHERTPGGSERVVLLEIIDRGPAP